MFKNLLRKIFKFKEDKNEDKFLITKIEDLSLEDKKILKIQYESLKNDLDIEYKKYAEINKKQVENINSICPKCKSDKVNNRIKRIEGDFHSSSSPSISSSLFSHSSSFSSNSSGKIDTNPVNKCNDCLHEWQIMKNYSHYTSLEQIAEYVCRFLDNANEAYFGEIEFNPNDLEEKFNSIEEKRKNGIDDILHNYTTKQVIKYFGNYSIELIQYVVDSELYSIEYSSTSHYYDKWINGDKSLFVSLLKIPSLKDEK